MNSKVIVNVRSKKISPYKKLGIATQALINNCQFEKAKELCFKAINIQDNDKIDNIINDYVSFNLVDQDLDNMTFRDVLELCSNVDFLFMSQYAYISISNADARNLLEKHPETLISFKDDIQKRPAEDYLNMILEECCWANDEEKLLFAHITFQSQLEDINETEDEDLNQSM